MLNPLNPRVHQHVFGAYEVYYQILFTFHSCLFANNIVPSDKSDIYPESFETRVGCHVSAVEWVLTVTCSCSAFIYTTGL